MNSEIGAKARGKKKLQRKDRMGGGAHNRGEKNSRSCFQSFRKIARLIVSGTTHRKKEGGEKKK